MSKMGQLVMEMQEMIEENVGAPNGLSFEQIANQLKVPVDWVENEYTFMLEQANGPDYPEDY